MENENKTVAYMRVGNCDQLDNSIEHIVEMAKRGEIKTLVVSTLERLCDEPERREALTKELASYGVEILTALDEDKKPRCCAIYNRHSVNDPERLAEMRGPINLRLIIDETTKFTIFSTVISVLLNISGITIIG